MPSVDDIREWINDNPKAGGGIAAGVVILTAILVIKGGAASSNRYAGPPPKAFFTVDDGKTYFPDDITNLPPFTTSEGKTAYRVRVVRVGTGAPFVSHLEKYAEQDKKSLEDALKSRKTYAETLNELMSPYDTRIIVKKPLTGDESWVTLTPQTAKRYQAVVQVKTPQGKPVTSVFPP